MKQLFLYSYFAGVQDIFEQYAENHQFEKQVLFIPTAGDVEEYTGYIDEAKEIFHQLGFHIEVLDLANCSQAIAQEKISHTNLLYVSGGNTFYLLQELKKKDLLKLIREKIATGLVYIGESAGAIITAADIAYSSIMDDEAAAKELTDYRALRMVDFYLVPHLGEAPFEESSQEILDTYGKELNLLALNNQQAALVSDQGSQVVTSRLS